MIEGYIKVKNIIIMIYSVSTKKGQFFNKDAHLKLFPEQNLKD